MFLLAIKIKKIRINITPSCWHQCCSTFWLAYMWFCQIFSRLSFSSKCTINSIYWWYPWVIHYYCMMAVLVIVCGQGTWQPCIQKPRQKCWDIPMQWHLNIAVCSISLCPFGCIGPCYDCCSDFYTVKRFASLKAMTSKRETLVSKKKKKKVQFLKKLFYCHLFFTPTYKERNKVKIT